MAVRVVAGRLLVVLHLRVVFKVAGVARVLRRRHDGRLPHAGAPTVARPRDPMSAPPSRPGPPLCAPRTGICLLYSASQSRPLNHLCFLTSSAPPLRLPRRLVRSAVSSRLMRSLAFTSKCDGNWILPARIFS